MTREELDAHMAVHLGLIMAVRQADIELTGYSEISEGDAPASAVEVGGGNIMLSYRDVWSDCSDEVSVPIDYFVLSADDRAAFIAERDAANQATAAAWAERQRTETEAEERATFERLKAKFA
jgi:hypothetical protein